MTATNPDHPPEAYIETIGDYVARLVLAKLSRHPILQDAATSDDPDGWVARVEVFRKRREIKEGIYLNVRAGGAHLGNLLIQRGADTVTATFQCAPSATAQTAAVRHSDDDAAFHDMASQVWDWIVDAFEDRYGFGRPTPTAESGS